jgi:hypothetical protein
MSHEGQGAEPRAGNLFDQRGMSPLCQGIYVARRLDVLSHRTMSATDQRINDLLFIRDGILIEIRRTADPKRVWELYLLKRDIDAQILALTLPGRGAGNETQSASRD